MNLIEQLGGYDEAKKQGEEWGFDDHLNNALLEYRRGHNIFEVGDMAVRKFGHDIIFEIAGCCIGGSNYIPRKGIINTDYVATTKGLPHKIEEIRHATDEEIAAGHRLN